MMKNPRNLLIFAILGGIVGSGFGFLLGIIISSQGSKSEHDVAISQIISVLNEQVEAWNSGEVEAYMQSYLKSDDLRFASGGDIETGWQPTLERYLRRYPDRSAMGELVTNDIDIKVIDADDALVFGTWELIRDTDRPSGLYTLHLKKINGAWVIVSDHTSSAN